MRALPAILIILFFSTSSFASALKQKACLPLSSVAAAKFTQAVPSYRHLEDNDLWILTMNVNDQNTTWQIWFGIIMKGIMSASEALEKGQAYFNHHVTLSQPTVEVENDFQFVCKYGLENNTYSVYAYSPPLADPR